MAEALVAIISFGLILIPLAIFCIGVARAARHTADSAAAFVGALGALLVIVGFIALVWTQLTFDDRHVPGAERWDVATGPLLVIGVGLLVYVGAQILNAVQDRERSRGTRV
jgi:uncharacterized membrane protein YidH (DUF202 family)